MIFPVLFCSKAFIIIWIKLCQIFLCAIMQRIVNKLITTIFILDMIWCQQPDVSWIIFRWTIRSYHRQCEVLVCVFQTNSILFRTIIIFNRDLIHNWILFLCYGIEFTKEIDKSQNYSRCRHYTTKSCLNSVLAFEIEGRKRLTESVHLTQYFHYVPRRFLAIAVAFVWHFV